LMFGQIKRNVSKFVAITHVIVIMGFLYDLIN
jgi:hypothetical protein